MLISARKTAAVQADRRGYGNERVCASFDFLLHPSAQLQLLHPSFIADSLVLCSDSFTTFTVPNNCRQTWLSRVGVRLHFFESIDRHARQPWWRDQRGGGRISVCLEEGGGTLWKRWHLSAERWLSCYSYGLELWAITSRARCNASPWNLIWQNNEMTQGVKWQMKLFDLQWRGCVCVCGKYIFSKGWLQWKHVESAIMHNSWQREAHDTHRLLLSCCS